MSSALVWILTPALFSILLFALRRWKGAVAVAGTIIALIMALLAWQLTIGELIIIGPWSFRIVDTLSIAGRQFVLLNEDRPMMMLIYIATAFWCGGALVARVSRLFVPLGISVVTVLIAALAVEPFLYAALLIEVAILLSVPILAPPGRSVGRGVSRFLKFYTLGMPFILIAGWLLTGLEATPGDNTLLPTALVVMGIGLAFLLAVFPLSSWVTMLAAESHPYAAAFIFSAVPSVVILFFITLLGRYPVIGTIQGVFEIVRFAGIIMVVTGGFWAAFQHHLGRIIGYALVIEIGRSLIAISVQDSVNLHFALILQRAVSMGIWALALTEIRHLVGDLTFRSVQGLARLYPILGLSVVVANFSLAGLPLFAGFPVYLTLWEFTVGDSLMVALWSLLGSVGLMAGGMRSFAVLVMGPEKLPKSDPLGRLVQVLLVLGVLAILLMGLFPQLYLPILSDFSQGSWGILP